MKAKPTKMLLGNSLRRMLVPGSVGAEHKCALLLFLMNYILEFGYSRAQRKNNVLGPYQNDCQLLQNNLVGVSIVDGLV